MGVRDPLTRDNLANLAHLDMNRLTISGEHGQGYAYDPQPIDSSLYDDSASFVSNTTQKPARAFDENGGVALAKSNAGSQAWNNFAKSDAGSKAWNDFASGGGRESSSANVPELGGLTELAGPSGYSNNKGKGKVVEAKAPTMYTVYDQYGHPHQRERSPTTTIDGDNTDGESKEDWKTKKAKLNRSKVRLQAMML